jgi:hypothetical protein
MWLLLSRQLDYTTFLLLLPLLPIALHVLATECHT